MADVQEVQKYLWQDPVLRNYSLEGKRSEGTQLKASGFTQKRALGGGMSPQDPLCPPPQRLTQDLNNIGV